MKQLSLLVLLFLSTPGTSHAQGIPDLRQYKTTEQKLKVLEVLSDSITEFNKPEEQKAIAKYALKLIPPTDYYNLSLFSFFLAYGHEYALKKDSCIYFYEKSIDYARKAKKPVRMTKALSRLIFIYSNTAGYRSKSEPTVKALLSILDTTRNEAVKVGFYSNIAEYYNMIGNYQTQAKYILSAVDIQKRLLDEGKLKDKEDIMVNLINLGRMYLETGQPEKGMEYTRESRKYLVNTHYFRSHYYKQMADGLLIEEKASQARTYYDSLTAMLASPQAGLPQNGNRIASDLAFVEYYLSHDKPDSAYIYSTRANQLASKWADEYLMAQVNYLTGRTYAARHEYKKALPLLKASETLAKESGLQMYVSLLQAIARAYAETGDYKKAYEYYDKYAPLRDTLHTEASQKTIADAEARYQNKDKQRQIEVKNIQLNEGQKQRLWLISGLSLLVLSLILLGIIYRNKRRTAEILDEKNHKLAELIDQLEEANRTKAKLFGIISHDLRSPISQVYQFLKLQQLNPQLLNESQKTELNARIQTATGSLLETMEDLLLWSKTQMNQFNADMQITDIAPLADQAVKLMQLNMEAKDLKAEMDIAGRATVWADPYYLQTILRNLLQNAIKAADAGSTVRLAFEENGESSALTIENSGKVFSQQNYAEILAHTENGHGLNGLGLKLVDELASKSGLKIAFQNPAEGLTQARITFKKRD